MIERGKKKMNDIDERWIAIGKLVEKYGSREEKIAWALCRGDAAEWRIASKGGIKEIKKKLRERIKKLNKNGKNHDGFQKERIMSLLSKVAGFFTRLDRWLEKAMVAETFAEKGMRKTALKYMQEEDKKK